MCNHMNNFLYTDTSKLMKINSYNPMSTAYMNRPGTPSPGPQLQVCQHIKAIRPEVDVLARRVDARKGRAQGGGGRGMG